MEAVEASIRKVVTTAKPTSCLHAHKCTFSTYTHTYFFFHFTRILNLAVGCLVKTEQNIFTNWLAAEVFGSVCRQKAGFRTVQGAVQKIKVNKKKKNKKLPDYKYWEIKCNGQRVAVAVLWEEIALEIKREIINIKFKAVKCKKIN